MIAGIRASISARLMPETPARSGRSIRRPSASRPSTRVITTVVSGAGEKAYCDSGPERPHVVAHPQRTVQQQPDPEQRHRHPPPSRPATHRPHLRLHRAIQTHWRTGGPSEMSVAADRLPRSPSLHPHKEICVRIRAIALGAAALLATTSLISPIASLGDRRRQHQEVPQGRHGQRHPRPRTRAAAHRQPERRHPRLRHARLRGLGRLRRQDHEEGRLQRQEAGVHLPVLPRARARCAHRRRQSSTRRPPSTTPGPATSPVRSSRSWTTRSPRAPTPSSSNAGCEAADFPAAPAEPAIALIQRGTCTFEVKADNALAAGYEAVIIFNEGQPGRTGAARPAPWATRRRSRSWD